MLSLIVAAFPILCSAQVFDSQSHLQSNNAPIDILQDITSQSESDPSDINKATNVTAGLNSLDTQLNPVLAFEVQSLTVKEDIGAVNIRVELLETNNSDVEVEVAFMQNLGTASRSDISGFNSQTIFFNGSDAPGTVKSVRISISDDGEYEQSENAVFRLQNISSGNLAEPSILTLIIQDDDTPNIVINEIFADPMEGIGDANGDGVVNTTSDQFVEMVNNEREAVDLSGWTLSDDFGTRFTFPNGTVLQPGTAAVVFGGGNPAGNFGGSPVFTAGNLGIDKSGDMLLLRDSKGIIVEQVEYISGANEGESLARSEEVTGALNRRHSDVSPNRNRLYSPGIRADGTSFGSRYALRLGGSEGWRLLSSPTGGTTFEELLGNFQIKTASVSSRSGQRATIYEWQDGRFHPVENLENEMVAGRGYAVYFSRDDDPGLPGIQGGFPKVITTNNPENSGPVSVTLSSAEFNGSRGWNLMGNPFGTEIAVDVLLGTLRRSLQIENPNLQVNGNVYIWDPAANSGNGDYLVWEEGGNHKILPFQAFWVKIDNAEAGENVTISTTLERDELRAENSSRFRDSNQEEFSLTLKLGDGLQYDDYQLVFNNEGSVDSDIQDAIKLYSLNDNSLSLFSLSGKDKLMKNVLPYELTGTMEIPLAFDANGRQELYFEWDKLDDIPDNWNITLTDQKLNKVINLRSANDYRFTVPSDGNRKRINEENSGSPLNRERDTREEPRFMLTVNPGSTASPESPDIPESVKLNPNYPNPFNPATTISYELKEDSEVLLSIWNIVGQRVVTLVDGMKEAGQHTANWNASEMPSGIYIAQLEVGGKVFIRKMTLIK